MRTAIVILALAALAGCGQGGNAHDAVKALVDDPDSAKFDKEVSQNGIVCGLVTAKSKATGAVAQTPFIYDAAAGARLLVEVPNRDSVLEITQISAADPSWQGKHDAFEAGCKFYLDWNAKCTGAVSLPTRNDQGVCRMWKDANYKFDSVLATLGLHQAP